MPMQQRKRITVQGLVQGVGFRPFVCRLAASLNLSGTVRNTPSGAAVEIQGHSHDVNRFLDRMHTDKPRLVHYHQITAATIPTLSESSFRIVNSDLEGEPVTWILPDVNICPDCLVEINDFHARRYQYPFTNCTNCGPRFTIITNLPYDRPHTVMNAFPLCAACSQEYTDTTDRRFHAQPIACPACGPSLKLTDNIGNAIPSASILKTTAKLIAAGHIIAFKGLGGYQLVVDATNQVAVARLRNRKHRPDKPFALLLSDLNTLNQLVHVSVTARQVLTSKEAPIVILKRKHHRVIAPAVAPR